jgi:hypothetical protein
MSFDVPINLFIPTASVNWKSLRRVDVVRAVRVVGVVRAVRAVGVVWAAVLRPVPVVFRVARRKNSGLAGLFFHSCIVLVVLTSPFTLHSASTAISMSSIKCECTMYLRSLIVECFFMLRLSGVR